MSSQLLVSVATVAVPAGGSVIVTHGLGAKGVAAKPTLIMPDRITSLAITAVTTTTYTVTNPTGASLTAVFRAEVGFSMELDAGVTAPMYWQGGATGGGGGMTAVYGDGPVTSTDPTGATTTIGLAASGVTAGAYGAASGGDESSIPTITVTAKGLVSAATQAAMRIGGSTAKAYVDAAAAAAQSAAQAYAEGLAFGIASKQPAHVATTTALPTYVGATQTLTASVNGAFPLIDGQTIALNERVLVKNETTEKYNGLYYLSQVGDGSTPWILTRTTDANSAQELCGALVSIETGPTNTGTLWMFSANALTFNLGVDPVVWQPMTMPNATTLVPGAVQLAGGLGGAGTTFSSPKLNMAHAASGTLATVRGGTGTSVPGAVGNVLTSDGTNWSSAAPAGVPLAGTLYVATTGTTKAAGATGSLSKPFDNVTDAIAEATILYGATAPVQINIFSGTYSASFTVNRKNLFFRGAGNRTEDNQATQIAGLVTISLSGVGSVYNDQISFSGMFITNTAGAVSILGSTACSVTFTNCYLNAVPNAGEATVKSVNGNVRLTIADSTVVSTGYGDAYSLSGLARFSDVQLVSSSGTAPSLGTLTGNGAAFLDRALVSYAGAGTAFLLSQTASPAAPTAPWLQSIGASSFTLVNSSLTAGVGAGIEKTVGATPSPVLETFITNTTFAVAAAKTVVKLAAGAYSAFNNQFFSGTSTLFTGGTRVDATELHSDMLFNAASLAASKPLLLDANKKLVTGNIGPTQGGTGFDTYAVGDLIYANTTTTLAKLTIGANGQFFGVVGGVPQWTNLPAGGTVSSVGAGDGLVVVGGGGPITSSGSLATKFYTSSASYGTSTYVPRYDDPRFNPAPNTAGRIPYDNGTGYSLVSAGAAGQIMQFGTTPGWATLTAGAGVTITNVTGTITIGLSNVSGLTAGAYGGSAAKTVGFTVDATGRVTAVAEYNISLGLSAVAGPTGIGFGVTSASGTWAAATISGTDKLVGFNGTAPATITIGSGLSLSGGTLSATGSGGTVTSITAGTGLTGGTITGVGTIALPSTGVAAGTYGTTSRSITLQVDVQGRILTISAADIAINATQISGGTLAINRGGTATATAPAANGVVVGNAAGTAYTSVAAGAEGQVFIAGATGGAPSFSSTIGKADTDIILASRDVGASASVSLISAADSFTVTAPVIRVVGGVAGGVTLISTPTINTTGIARGTRLTIVNEAVASFTLQDEAVLTGSGIQLGGVNTRTIGQYQSIDLVLIETTAGVKYWVERAIGGSGTVLSVSPDAPTVANALVTVDNTTTPSSPKVGIRGLTGDNPATTKVGGIPYFSDAKTLTPSGTLTQNALVVGGGTSGAPAPLASLGTAGQTLTSQGAGLPPVWAAAPYDIAGTIAGSPSGSDGDEVFRFVCVRAGTMPVAAGVGTVHRGAARVAPTGVATTFKVWKNDSTVPANQLGTMDFAISSKTATFTITATTFSAGDVVIVTRPASLNGLSDTAFTFLMTSP